VELTAERSREPGDDVLAGGLALLFDLSTQAERSRR
jgi:hypothetical protein